MFDVVIALRRFGLGARPGQRTTTGDVRAALVDRLAEPARYLLDEPGLPTLADAARDDKEAGSRRERLRPDQEARLRRALSTQDGFAERLVWFWSNHFTVSATKGSAAPFTGLFDRQVVRPHLAGSFASLLLASTRHAAMSHYLDQAVSIGPNSEVGQKRERGLNENLAREVLELHTLGVHGGYGQTDVEEFAKALTGWTVAEPRLDRYTGVTPPGTPVFVAAWHEPGARTVLGTTYVHGGPDQAEGILEALARHPATATHVATQLARHFIADDPPADAVSAIATSFLASHGDLPTVHTTLVDQASAWAPGPKKRLSPHEWLVSSLRLLGSVPDDLSPWLRALESMGQPLYGAPSPAGWPDSAASWGGADALARKIEIARKLARSQPLTDRPEARLVDVLGRHLTPETVAVVARAESVEQAVVLMLLCPELLWR